MTIERVETLYDASPGATTITFVRVHDSSGAVGLGETYYTPRTVAAYVHEVIAPALIGTDALRDGLLWTEQYEASARRGAGGTDMRALSAVDLALWDLKGKLLDAPVYQLLGGGQPDGVRAYNTCAGAVYATGNTVGRGPHADQDDLWRALNAPGELALELLEEGYSGMKLWPYDQFADRDRGRSIAGSELEHGRRIMEQIRHAAGSDIEIMLEGHGKWHLQPAIQILQSIDDLDIRWAEDMVLANDPTVLSRLNRASRIPVAASEYLVGRWEFRRALEVDGIGYLHLDPSWCGGISEGQQILALASTYGVVASMHDCTGPMNLLAGLHLAAANPIVGYQEVLRAFLSEVYPRMVDVQFRVESGRIAPPDLPGLGANLSDEYLASPELIREVS
jgi:L-alanine-DL-glutamate epimerase-like enolase superfamily enzyme